MRYRKLPVEIDAVQFTPENQDELELWLDENGAGWRLDRGYLELATLEGPITATPGDFIIRGVAGEFYPCKPDIFNLTYEPVT